MDAFLKDVWLPIHSSSDPQTLYHYTDLSGLRGILESRAFWCSDALSTNDPLEIKYGQKIISEVLSELESDSESEDLVHFFRMLRNQVATLGTIIHHPFIACFCESGSLLSQWRSYGRNGGGYSIGVTFDDFTKTTTDVEGENRSRPLFLRRVVYDQNRQKKLARQYLIGVQDSVVSELGGPKIAFPERRLRASKMSLQVGSILLDMALCFKHEAFSEEAEWRLIKVSRADYEPELLHFRETENALVPYRILYVLDGKTRVFPVDCIHFGPSHEASSTGTALKLLVHKEAERKHELHILPHGVRIEGAGFSLRPS